MSDIIEGFLESMENFENEMNEDMSFLQNGSTEKADPEATEGQDTQDMGADIANDVEPTNGIDSSVVFSAQNLALELGTSKQSVRNYTKQYSEFIKPFYDTKGQAFYSNEDLDVMRTIAGYKKQRMDPDSIRRFLSQKYGARERSANVPALPDTPQTPAINSEEMVHQISVQVSDIVEEKIRSFFDIGMKGIATRLDSVSSSMDELGTMIKDNTESVNKQESLSRSLEGTISRNTDVVSDLQKNVSTRIDRSISRTEASIGKLQSAVEQNNEALSKERDKISGSLEGIQKDMERIRSSNVSKKVDDLGRSITENIDRDKKQREEQNRELIKMINKALTPPEFHPEDTDAFKELKDRQNQTQQALEKARSAVENMNKRLNEQDEIISGQKRTLQTQVAQISALNSQVQRLKTQNARLVEQNRSAKIATSVNNRGKNTEAGTRGTQNKEGTVAVEENKPDIPKEEEEKKIVKTEEKRDENTGVKGNGVNSAENKGMEQIYRQITDNIVNEPAPRQGTEAKSIETVHPVIRPAVTPKPRKKLFGIF